MQWKTTDICLRLEIGSLLLVAIILKLCLTMFRLKGDCSGHPALFRSYLAVSLYPDWAEVLKNIQLRRIGALRVYLQYLIAQTVIV